MRRSLPSHVRTTTLFFLTLVTSLSDAAFAQMPNNLDFENGNFNNWICWIGKSAVGTPATGTRMDSTQLSLPIGGNPPCAGPNQSRHYITSGTGGTTCSTIPEVCPTGALHSLRLGNINTDHRADRVQYYLHVPAAAPSYNLRIQYVVVLNQGHPEPEKAPTFQVLAYDSVSRLVLPKSNSLYVNPILTGNMQKTTSVSYLPWTPSTINLKGMSGKTVLLEISAIDCADGGHFGYAYFDVVDVRDTLQADVVRYSATCDSVTLQAPLGYKSYQWFDQNYTHAFNAPGDTATTRSLPVPATAQMYNLILTPYDANGTPDTIQSPLIKPCALKAEIVSKPAVKVFPNPANNILHVELDTAFDGLLTVVNALGQNVFEQPVSNITGFDLPTSNFPPGLYRLVLRGRDGAMRTSKILVSR